MIKEFDAQLSKGDNPGAWTCVIVDDVHTLFGTRGLVKIRGAIDGKPFDGALMAQGDVTVDGQAVTLKAQTSAQLEGQAGATVKGPMVTLAGNTSFSPS